MLRTEVQSKVRQVAQCHTRTRLYFVHRSEAHSHSKMGNDGSEREPHAQS